MPKVLYERDDRIARITLNRPEVMNAIDDDLPRELADAVARADADDEVHVMILSGAGKAFCAGHDLKEMSAGRRAADGGAAYFADLFARCSVLMQTIPQLPQPVIAEVHGIATAAGCQLVASCDMAVAAKGTKFGVNGVNIGLFCSTPMVALSRNVPRKQAFEMLTTGQFADAERAREIGLVNRVVPEDQLGAETAALADLVEATGR